MNFPNRKQRAKEALYDSILDAARELFVARGYEAVTMRAIAKKIDYSATAIYLHFKDKEALCQALCDRDWLSFGQRFAGLLDLADPVERLRAASQVYIEFGTSLPNHYRWLFLTAHPDVPPECSEIVKGDPREDAYAFLRQTVSECISHQRFLSEYSDVDYTAQILWAGVHGVVGLHIARLAIDMSAWVDWVEIDRLALGMVDTLLASMLRQSSTEQG
jgi:AcrR family transcriptional regulator